MWTILAELSLAESNIYSKNPVDMVELLIAYRRLQIQCFVLVGQ